MNDQTLHTASYDDADARTEPDAHSAPFYIAATASLAELRPRILKSDDEFAVFGHNGDISGPATGGSASAEGLYYRDTRYLSRLGLALNGARPMLLSSAVSGDNAMLTCDLANPDLPGLDHGEIHIRRSKFLLHAACHERLAIRNFSGRPQRFMLEIGFAADFVDLFEVRGTTREKRGTMRAPRIEDGTIVLAYDGLDDVRRSMVLSFDPVPARLESARAGFDVELEPGALQVINIEMRCVEGESAPAPQLAFLPAMRAARRSRREASERSPGITTDNEIFNEAIRRAQADLTMLVTETPQGPYPYAGIPWFSAAFGRDALITALQTLWLDPGITRGVLRYLAAHQATETDAASDAEPGKILHEVRHGEMAMLGEVPFRHYYGAVDSTPLFIMLAGAYLARTDDLDTIRALWPNIEAALRWIDRYGDADGDGFVEYGRKSKDGLVNQGWKDSQDSIFHADGRLAEGPIALAEVQGYVFAAKTAAAHIASLLGRLEQARRLHGQAAALQANFERVFWNDEL
ncbi:MAG TPA: glycogen debranching N-terminal domain-containing protein, partial [Acetobacteraceae bacterium]|nr:glycogen debranching N-terminal domain-containing protein [Acetobacteraceae bacterium]